MQIAAPLSNRPHTLTRRPPVSGNTLAGTRPEADSFQTATSPAPLLLPAPQRVSQVKTDLNEPLALTRAELNSPLKNKAWQEALKEIDPELNLADLTATLFEQDPAAANDSSYELKRDSDGDFNQISLKATRELSQGKVTTTSSAWVRNGGKVHRNCRAKFTSDKLPSVQQLPEVMQNRWSDKFQGSPQKLVDDFQAKWGDPGELSDFSIYFGLEKEHDYASLHCRVKQDGLDGHLRFTKEQTDYSLVVEEKDRGKQLPGVIGDTWEKSGLDPQDIADGMLRETGLNVKSIKPGISISDGSVSLNNAVTLQDPNNPELKNAGFLNRTFFKDAGSRPSVYHDFFKLDKELQGQGYGKKILRNSFKLYRDLKVSHVDLTAAITVGGYAWARYGWQLKDTPGNHENINSQVKEKLQAIDVPTKVKKVVQKLLESKNPKRIWALSDLDHEVEKDGKKMKLGKALLLGTNWKGTLDMDDKATMKRLDNYLG